jgi:hypothetical protein
MADQSLDTGPSKVNQKNGVIMMAKKRAFWLTIVSLGCVLLTGCCSYAIQDSSSTIQRFESFGLDPGWDGVNNHIVDPDPPVVRQRFGWNPTNFAGGKGEGEIGGVVWRSATQASYGMVLDREYTLDDTLTCSGSFSLSTINAINQWHTGSAIWIGFFNSKEQGWRPINFLGLDLLGQRDYEFHDFKGIPVGAMPSFHLGTAKYATRADGPKIDADYDVPGRMRNWDQNKILRFLPDNQSHTWKLKYEPQDDGSGMIYYWLDDFPPGKFHIHKTYRQGHGATFNRFGIFNERLPGYPMTGFFDDITVNDQFFDFAEDPGWEGVNNNAEYIDTVQYGVHDFGYSSESNHAGGDKPGEIGGRMFAVHHTQDNIKAHYGGDAGRLTLDDKLFARGKVAFTAFGTDSSMRFGWFNSAEQGWPVKNFVGVYLDSLSDAGRFIQASYGTSQGNTGDKYDPENWPWFMPDGRVYEWTLSYDPEAAEGRGAITFNMDDKSQTLELAEGAREEGAVMDRFGIFNNQGNNGKYCEIYMDDIEYTVREEN